VRPSARPDKPAKMQFFWLTSGVLSASSAFSFTGKLDSLDGRYTGATSRSRWLMTPMLRALRDRRSGPARAWVRSDAGRRLFAPCCTAAGLEWRSLLVAASDETREPTARLWTAP